MAHLCTICGSLCYCGGDNFDHIITYVEEHDCTHCNDVPSEDEHEDYEELSHEYLDHFTDANNPNLQ